MSRTRTALSIAVTAVVAAALLAPSPAVAQDRTASVVGFGGMGVNTFSTTQPARPVDRKVRAHFMSSGFFANSRVAQCGSHRSR